MGSSGSITYIDGPPEQEAREFVQMFSTSAHDPTADYTAPCSFEYEGRTYRGGVRHLDRRRKYSRNFVGERIRTLLDERNRLEAVAIRAHCRRPFLLCHSGRLHREAHISDDIFVRNGLYRADVYIFRSHPRVLLANL